VAYPSWIELANKEVEPGEQNLWMCRTCYSGKCRPDKRAYWDSLQHEGRKFHNDYHSWAFQELSEFTDNPEQWVASYVTPFRKDCPLPDYEELDTSVRYRLTSEEKQFFEEEAAKRGIDASEFFRRSIRAIMLLERGQEMLPQFRKPRKRIEKKTS
jgi:hypothetical protein